MIEPLEAPPSGEKKSSYVFVAVLTSASAILAAVIGILPFLLGYFNSAPQQEPKDGKVGSAKDWDGRKGVLVVDSVEVLKTNPKGQSWDSIASEKPDLFIKFQNLSSGQKAQTPLRRNTFETVYKLDMVRVQEGDAVRIQVFDNDRLNRDELIGETKIRLTKELWKKESSDWSFGRVKTLKVRVRK